MLDSFDGYFNIVTPQAVPWAVVRCALTQPEVFARLGQVAEGSAYPAVDPWVIGETIVVLPGNDLIRRLVTTTFQQIAEPLFLRMDLNWRQGKLLAETRDFLLPSLIAGDIRVSEPERAIEEAG